MKKLVSMFLGIAMLLSMSTSAMAIAIDEVTLASSQQTITEYIYPVTPGTDEWSELETFSQRLAACRIPQDTLENMTSLALVNAVLDFPFLGNILIYENTEVGFENLLIQCDALRELLTRSDGPNLLSEAYLSLTTTMQTKASAEYETYGVKILYPLFLESIIGQADVYNGMDYSHQLAIEIATASYNEGEYSHLDGAIEQEGNSVTRAISTPKTPKGNAVEYYDFSYKPLFDSSTKAAANEYIKSVYTIIDVISDPNPRYNCHSYAWHSTSTSNTYWINDPAIYMSDGSYSEKSSGGSGYKVFYKNDEGESSDITGETLGNHSGIVVSGSGRTMIIKSKWGEFGVYTHYIYNSCYSGNKTKYSFWN